MKLSQKLLLSICSIGLLMTANSSAWAADAPKKDSSANDAQRRDAIRQKRREASMRERDSLMKHEPRRDANSASPNTNSGNNNSNNATHTPPSKPERPAKPARGSKRGSAAASN